MREHRKTGPTGPLTPEQMLSYQLTRRAMEEGVETPSISFEEPVGSKRKLSRTTTCGKCRKRMKVGDSFRLRRVSSTIRRCHISC